MQNSYQSNFTQEHYLEYHKLIFARLLKLPGVKKWRIGREISSWLISISIGLLGVEVYNLIGRQLSLSLVIYLIIGIASLIAWFVLCHVVQYRIAKFGISEFGAILGETTFTVSDSGISEVGVRHELYCSWEAVFEVIESPNFLVFLTDPAFGIGCSRTFIPDEQYDSLLTYCREKIAKRGRTNQ